MTNLETTVAPKVVDIYQAACEGGCGWEIGPGEVAEFGELAGICTRCA